MEIQKENLKKDLKDRHIQLIAIGGVIGVALFMGSAQSIKLAGPGLILSYALGGIIMYFVLRALGEVAVEYPVSSSFAGYAKAFLGPKISYMTGWTYWYMWVIICMAEISAVGLFIKFWWPDFPQWITASITLALMVTVNLIAVKVYGEFEFWFALIKVVTIICMLVLGGAMILFGLGNGGVPVGFSNLWSHGGFLPFGWTGVGMALVMVTWAYSGVELIGITSGEAKDAERSLSSAIDKVFWRVLIFYVGSCTVILSIYPWDTLGTKVSPFVSIFDKMGIPYAASIMNFVIMTSAASCLNSGLYICGRMLYGLSLRNEAPQFLGKLNSAQVPVNGILFTGAVSLIGVFLNWYAPENVFYYMGAVSVTGSIWAWMVIMLIHLKWRRGLSPEQVAKLKFPMPLYPFGNYLVIGFLLVVIVMMRLDHDNLVGLYIAPFWYGGLWLLYHLCKVDEAQKRADPTIKTEW